jgi:HAD superfamily hydrolase (TIGR01509 family)
MTLLIFDCDGTLVDSELVHAQVEVDLIVERFGLVSTAVEHNRELAGAGVVKLISVLEERIGAPVPQDFLAELGRRKIPAFQKHLKAVPYMSEVLDILADFPKCVASNTPLATVEVALRVTDLHKHFDPHVYSAQMVERGKPAPDLFLYAARKMGADPQDCIVIEDSHHGVAAALAANMRVFGYMGGSHCYPEYRKKLQEAELIFSDMRELPELLKSIR